MTQRKRPTRATANVVQVWDCLFFSLDQKTGQRGPREMADRTSPRPVILRYSS